MQRLFHLTRRSALRSDSANRAKVPICLSWLAVVCLAIAQDAWFAFLKDTSFYWSESLLYKIYWLLFIPQTLLVAHLAQKWSIQSDLLKNGTRHLVTAFISSLIHVLLFSGLVAGASGVLLGYTFRFEGVLRKSLSEDFFIGILMYGLLLLVFNRFSQRNKQEKVPRILPQQTTPTEFLTTLLIKDGAKTTLIDTDSLDWIGSEDSYTVLHGAAGKWLYSESLSKLEKQLNPADFVRIHRSCIVNIHRVQKVVSRRTGDYDVQLTNGALLRLSRHYAGKVKGRLI